MPNKLQFTVIKECLFGAPTHCPAEQEIKLGKTAIVTLERQADEKDLTEHLENETVNVFIKDFQEVWGIDLMPLTSEKTPDDWKPLHYVQSSTGMSYALASYYHRYCIPTENPRVHIEIVVRGDELCPPFQDLTICALLSIKLKKEILPTLLVNWGLHSEITSTSRLAFLENNALNFTLRVFLFMC